MRKNRLFTICATAATRLNKIRFQLLLKLQMLLVSCNVTGRVQVRGPATAKLLSLNWVLVRGTTHVHASADRRHHVDRLQPPTDSRWRGTAQCETV